MSRICHMTSAHPVKDVRIFYKECKALQEIGLEVHLLSRSKRSNTQEGIHIIRLQPFSNRFIRILLYPWIILIKAFKVKAAVYHFHDPELIFIGFLLKLAGKKVIYDVHENVPLQVTAKSYLIQPFRWLSAKAVKSIEEMGVGLFDGTIVATESIKQRFPARYFPKILVIRNFVDPSEIRPRAFSGKQKMVCYVGGISYNRGIDLLVRSIEGTGLKLVLAGKFHNSGCMRKVKKLEGWKNVSYTGVIGRKEIEELYGDSYMGLLLLRPRDGFKDSLPIKLFEYMAAGIPVLASDFPLWKEIIEENQCGICVDPLNVEEVRKQIKKLFANTALAEKMGKKGRELVIEKYNWNREKEKLQKFYFGILGDYNH